MRWSVECEGGRCSLAVLYTVREVEELGPLQQLCKSACYPLEAVVRVGARGGPGLLVEEYSYRGHTIYKLLARQGDTQLYIVDLPRDLLPCYLYCHALPNVWNRWNRN